MISLEDPRRDPDSGGRRTGLSDPKKLKLERVVKSYTSIRVFDKKKVPPDLSSALDVLLKLANP